MYYVLRDSMDSKVPSVPNLESLESIKFFVSPSIFFASSYKTF